MRQSFTVAVALVLALSGALQAQEPDKPANPDEKAYEIRLARPSKVGDTVRIEATGATKKTTVLTIDGKEQKPLEELYGISVDGTIKVLEATAKGIETKLSLTIDSCVAKVGEQSLPLLPRGTVIIAAWDKENRDTRFTLDDKELPQDVAELLDLIVTTSDPESVSDDEIFGSKEKRKAGDSWAIDAVAAARELERLGLKVKPEHLFGETSLEKVVDVNGVPNIVVVTDFTARSLTSDGKRGKTLKIESGNLKIKTKVTLPVDPSLPPSRASMEMTLSREMAGANEAGKDIRASEMIERQSERKIVPAGK